MFPIKRNFLLLLSSLIYTYNNTINVLFCLKMQINRMYFPFSAPPCMMYLFYTRESEWEKMAVKLFTFLLLFLFKTNFNALLRSRSWHLYIHHGIEMLNV